MKYLMIGILVILTLSCRHNNCGKDMQALKQEIEDTERAFARMALDSGIEAAFKAYAAPDAVLKRGNTLVSGYDSIVVYLDKNRHEGAELLWSPDFISVSGSGDLAYTYGGYVYTFPDSSGVIRKQEGFFHTVWKRQPGGDWKFVWD
ncbi:MAG: nuclear transport factor 2 family protein [Bacteroidales bacterium]|nr:nuclear transport factor 2 family protein [Bacteroidales bacterium]